MLITIHATPNAKENTIDGILEDGQLHIRTTATPERGKANDAIVKMIAKHFKIPKSCISLVKGKNARKKVISIDIE